MILWKVGRKLRFEPYEIVQINDRVGFLLQITMSVHREGTAEECLGWQ